MPELEHENRNSPQVGRVEISGATNSQQHESRHWLSYRNWWRQSWRMRAVGMWGYSIWSSYVPAREVEWTGINYSWFSQRSNAYIKQKRKISIPVRSNFVLHLFNWCSHRSYALFRCCIIFDLFIWRRTTQYEPSHVNRKWNLQLSAIVLPPSLWWPNRNTIANFVELCRQLTTELAAFEHKIRKW